MWIVLKTERSLFWEIGWKKNSGAVFDLIGSLFFEKMVTSCSFLLFQHGTTRILDKLHLLRF